MHPNHVHNVIAKTIREELDEVGSSNEEIAKAARGVLIRLAMRFAMRFMNDDPNFNAFIFLDRCSPNPELYPISELWKDE